MPALPLKEKLTALSCAFRYLHLKHPAALCIDQSLRDLQERLKASVSPFGLLILSTPLKKKPQSVN